MFEDKEIYKNVINKIMDDNPKIIRDQLRGLQQLRKQYSLEVWEKTVPVLHNLTILRCSIVEKFLEENKRILETQNIETYYQKENIKIEKSVLDRALNNYLKGIKNALSN